jgi:micrococcal nuclease
MRFRILLIIIISFIFTALINSADKKDKYIYYNVRKVVDGDTFWIDDGSLKGLKVRLIGVDAPESRNSGTKEMAFFGREASDYLTALISGRKVRLEYDVGHFDKYGRTLAYVYLEDGTFVNATLVKNGYATVMTVPPNVKYADTFLKLERKARNKKKGLWGGMTIPVLQREFYG